MALAPADPRATSSPSSCRGEGLGDRGRAGAAHHESRWTVVAGARVGRGRRVERERAGRERHRGRDHLVPPIVSATCTAQSVRPSSPNSRVPSSGSTIHTRSAPSRTGSSAASSDSTASSGWAAGEGGDDEVVRRPVALGPEVGGIGAGCVHRRPQRDQELARLGGDGGGVAVVVGGRGHGGGR